MREVAALNLDARVPTCPDWNVGQLVEHTTNVYAHKAETMRRGAFPKDWPPERTGDVLDNFDQAYADLLAEFGKRSPDDTTPTWYPPEQNVRFWIRRMAQETVIHRVDAELALKEDVAPIPDDFAVDGVDELLICFLDFQSREYAQYFPLPKSDLAPVAISTGGRTWTATMTPKAVNVDGAGDAPARIEGEPNAMLLWLWRRAEGGVNISGDESLVAMLQENLREATQ